jgi:hypothetical protein
MRKGPNAGTDVLFYNVASTKKGASEENFHFNSLESRRLEIECCRADGVHRTHKRRRDRGARVIHHLQNIYLNVEPVLQPVVRPLIVATWCQLNLTRVLLASIEGTIAIVSLIEVAIIQLDNFSLNMKLK